MKNKKILIVLILTVLVLTITAVIFIKVSKEDKPAIEEYFDAAQLETDFNKIFDNQENGFCGTLYNIEEEKSGKYSIQANIPYVYIDNEIDNKINKEINDIFVNKLLQIISASESYTILKIDYASSVNENIFSLAIKCVLKEGNQAQRTIIKTYNYDIQNLKEIGIMDIVPEEKAGTIQKQINEKVEKQIKKEETIIEQGYNVYRRDKNSEIYILENATEFYIKDNILYIIYSYGNNNYTSEVDLIINKI